MEKHRARITYGLVLLALGLAAWAASAMPKRAAKPEPIVAVAAPPPLPPPPTPPPVVETPPAPVPRVEVMFALDTTSSMTGLIQGAKRKIWSIAQTIAQAQPKPEVRIGLVAFRDKGDAYVTRFYDLSDDLDKVFDRLSSFRAEGGGDTPEHVSRALYDAVYRASWTRDQSALKQIYLVGDAPPHTDYRDGYDYRAIAAHARDLGIHINTIRCGVDAQTQAVWRQIASIASGAYASINQSGGVRVVASPYDEKLADLNKRLLRTAIPYGKEGEEVKSKAEKAFRLPITEAADRAGFFGATGGATSGRGDLVKDSSGPGGMPVTAVPPAALPPELRALPAAERPAYVEKKREERERITREINDLAARRKTWMRSSAPKKPADAFDDKINDALRKQGAEMANPFSF